MFESASSPLSLSECLSIPLSVCLSLLLSFLFYFYVFVFLFFLSAKVVAFGDNFVASTPLSSLINETLKIVYIAVQHIYSHSGAW